MTRAALFAFLAMLLFHGLSRAQSVPPPPKPIVETDLRDNTIRMRSIELERIKRAAHKVTPEDDLRDAEARFAEIKERFENIQKLQDSIVKAYTTGKRINYSKINRSASAMSKDAQVLDEYLFGAGEAEAVEVESAETNGLESSRDLIVLLDQAIGKFVSSPMFQNVKVVDKDTSREAQLELKKIMRLSTRLSVQSARNK